MKKLLITAVITVGMITNIQASQIVKGKHASNMSTIDDVISLLEVALQNARQIRSNHETIAQHKVTATSMKDSKTFANLNNKARQGVEDYAKTSDASLKSSTQHVGQLHRQATAIKGASDKALSDTSIGVQSVTAHNETAKSTLKEHKKDTENTADLADSVSA